MVCCQSIRISDIGSWTWILDEKTEQCDKPGVNLPTYEVSSKKPYLKVLRYFRSLWVSIFLVLESSGFSRSFVSLLVFILAQENNLRFALVGVTTQLCGVGWSLSFNEQGFVDLWFQDLWWNVNRFILECSVIPFFSCMVFVHRHVNICCSFKVIIIVIVYTIKISLLPLESC